MKSENATKYKVTEAYTDAPANPIEVTKGEELEFVEESDPTGPWPNWILCKGDAKEGWVPKQILVKNGDTVTAEKDYTAKEHSLSLGEILIAEFSLNGWIWSEKESVPGEYAWAPLNHLLVIE